MCYIHTGTHTYMHIIIDIELDVDVEIDVIHIYTWMLCTYSCVCGYVRVHVSMCARAHEHRQT